MDTLIPDLRYAARMLLKQPAFTALAVLTLALGIGMTSAMFSFVDAVLLKPLDYKDAESLVEIWELYPKGGRSNPSPPTYLEWKELNTVFSQVSIYGNTVGLNLSDATGSEQIQARYVSADYFDMLAVRPVFGRTFQPGDFFVRSLNFVVRTSGDPMPLAATIQGIARSIDRDQPIYAIKTMDQVISDSLAQPRFRTVLFGIFGSLALILAAVGIYSVMSYSAAQRTKEIGIRMSLGARPRDIFTQVVAQGMLFALIGIAIGCAGAFGLTRLIASLLFEITANDPTTFVLIALLLTAVAFIACWQPARRAMKTDPLLAIRE